MSVLNLILQWILHNRGRSLLTMLSVAASFVLFGLLQGMNQGVDAYINSVSATRLLVAYRASIVGFLPKAYAERIRGVQGVSAVADMSFFGGYFQEARNALPMFATDIRAFSEVYTELHIPETVLRAMKDMRSGAIVSRPVASRFGWKVGDTVPVGTSIWPNRDGTSTWPITIAGIYELADKSDLPNMVLINYEYFDAGRTRLNGRTNNYVVRIDGTRPARAIAAEIDRMFANSDGETRTQSERELAQAQMQQAADIKLVADVTAGAVMFMLLFVTGNTMMQAFRERTTQLAVLRTIGFPPYRVVALLVSEALFLCVLSAAIGLLVARLLFPIGRAAAFDPHSTLGSIEMPYLTVAFGIAAAGLLALCSALPAAWRAGRLNVVDALAER